MTDDKQRLDLLQQAHDHARDVVAQFRAAGVTADIGKLEATSVYSWIEVAGYFEGDGAPFFRSTPSGAEIYTIRVTKDLTFTAPTMTSAVALAAEHPHLRRVLGLPEPVQSPGVVETGGELYEVAHG